MRPETITYAYGGSNMRPETGIMEFDGDWPGVFIRGDNAAAYSYALQEIISQLETDDSMAIFLAEVKSLKSVLDNSNCNNEWMKENKPQMMKKYQDCIKEE